MNLIKHNYFACCIIVTLCLFVFFSVTTEVSALAVSQEQEQAVSQEQEQIVIPADNNLRESLIYDPDTNIVYFKTNDGVYYPYYSSRGNLYRYNNGVLEEVSKTDIHYTVMFLCIVSLLVLLPYRIKSVSENEKRKVLNSPVTERKSSRSADEDKSVLSSKFRSPKECEIYNTLTQNYNKKHSDDLSSLSP